MRISRKSKKGVLLLSLALCLVWGEGPARTEAAAKDVFDVVQITKKPVDEYTSFRISGDGKKLAYRVSTEISKDGRLYSLYLVDADGSGSPVLIDSAATSYPELGVMPVDISYDGGKALYKGNNLSVGYIIHDAPTGSNSELGPFCVSDQQARTDDHCLGPYAYEHATLSGDGAYLFFSSYGTLENCTVERKPGSGTDDPSSPLYWHWVCPNDSGNGKIFRVYAGDPSNKDGLVEWAEIKGPLELSAGISSLEADHTGGLIFVHATSGTLYALREKGEPEELLSRRYDSEPARISPDGKWLAYPEDVQTNYGIVVSSLDKKSKYSFKLDSRFKLKSKVYPLDIGENASWILVGVNAGVYADKYKLAAVRRNGSGFSALPGYASRNLASLSYDGNSVAFIGYDKNKKEQLYAATRSGACKASNLNQRASSNYDNLPEEARKIMTDGCASDDEKIMKITTLVEGWLKEKIIDSGDLSEYIIPTLEATQDLKNGYHVFENLSYTPYFKTLSKELMDSKLTSSLLEKMSTYCKKKNDNKLCEKALLKKTLLLCSGAIAPISKQAYEGFIEKVAKNIYLSEDMKKKNSVKYEMADEILNAEGFSTWGFVSFFGKTIIDFIPVGQIISYIKKGYDLFSDAKEAYENLEASNIRVKEYTYTSALDKNEYKITAAVMLVPDLAKLQILMARSDKVADKEYVVDERYTIFANWPLSIATVKTIGKEEYLRFDWEATDSANKIFKNAMEFFKGFEEKGYTKARNIDRYDYY